jgi:hypothetical protein
LLSLPPVYSSFIRNKFIKGSALVYIEGQAKWLRYQVGEMIYFQVGSWGDISPQEYLDGSPIIRDYAHKTGLESTDWKLDGYLFESGPESEWGSEPGMAEVQDSFCFAEGYQFVRIHLPHPNDFSRLAFNCGFQLLEQSIQEPTGVIVEKFTQFDSQAAIQSGLLPLWLIFNTHDSLPYLKKMCPKFNPFKPVFFSTLETFQLLPILFPGPIGRQLYLDGIGSTSGPVQVTILQMHARSSGGLNPYAHGWLKTRNLFKGILIR